MASMTRSGRDFAFCSRFFDANSEDARSVPAETKEAAILTRTQPGRTRGGGTSATSIDPVRALCNTCFMQSPAVQLRVHGKRSSGRESSASTIRESETAKSALPSHAGHCDVPGSGVGQLRGETDHAREYDRWRASHPSSPAGRGPASNPSEQQSLPWAELRLLRAGPRALPCAECVWS